MSEFVQLDEDTVEALVALRAEDETFDELVARLLDARRKRILDGAGLWEGTDAAEAAREARERAKRDVGAYRSE